MRARGPAHRSVGISTPMYVYRQAGAWGCMAGLPPGFHGSILRYAAYMQHVQDRTVLPVDQLPPGFTNWDDYREYTAWHQATPTNPHSDETDSRAGTPLHGHVGACIRMLHQRLCALEEPL